jgi:hypothetical protein
MAAAAEAVAVIEGATVLMPCKKFLFLEAGADSQGGEQPAALQHGGAEGSQVAGFPRGGVDGGNGQRQERHCIERNALCAAVEPEARAAPQVTPTLLPWSSFLSVAVLSWTIKDILDEGLYKNKVLIALEPHPSLVIPFVWLAAYSRPRRAVQLRRLIVLVYD